MTITVKYFASLAEMRGKEKERIHLEGEHTAHMLYATLQERHDLRFDEKDIRVAINHEYRDFSFQLHDEDIVVFISPVSGG